MRNLLLLLRISIVFSVITLLGCLDNHQKNHLGKEKSAYLLQHAKNPIWWYTWSEEAFAYAKKYNKLIFMSVGYSTCHWCHVMEKESFEDQEVANVLNKDFVSIKVDREERPDVDAIYMDAVRAISRTGGWPMTVILTPDRKPFFGATYIPKENLLTLLRRAQADWVSTPKKIIKHSEQVVNLLKLAQPPSITGPLSQKELVSFYRVYSKSFDTKYGSLKGKPKFPPGYALRMLLRIHRRTGDAKALKMVRLTLDKMAQGGIYDHLMGGFHRYSVDEKWLVPHFEKMLYDQASLVKAYLEAYQVTGDDEYRLVVTEILDYVLREMTSPSGGFYSAQDADSSDGEGHFAVWKKSELQKILDNKRFTELDSFYPVSEHGNFENQLNILTLTKPRKEFTKSLRSTLEIMKKTRNQRDQPLRDEKIITAWNGLMISAMASAGVVLNRPNYVEAARKAGQFILKNCKQGSSLKRRWIEGESRYAGTLKDYAMVIDGFIELYGATFDESWLSEARQLQNGQDKTFSHESGGYYSTVGDDKTLLIRKQVHADNVIPAGQSISALNLLRLADLFLDKSFRARVEKIFADTPKYIGKYPGEFPQLLMALDYALDNSKEVAVIGDRNGKATKKLLDSIRKGFNPNKVVALGKESSLPLLQNRIAIKGAATVYVCEHSVCKLPTSNSLKVEELVKSYVKYSL